MSRPDAVSAAERMRRLRARRRRGEVVVPVPISEGVVVGWLIDVGRLSERDAEDHDEVAKAIARILREICASR